MEDSNSTEPKVDYNEVKSHLRDYIDNRIAFLKLSAIEIVAGTVPGIALFVIILLLFSVFWIFANVAAVLAIAKMIQSLALAFLIISGCNLALAAVFIMGYKGLLAKPLGNMIVKLLTDKLLKDNEDK
jgi:hypothetical protein